MSAINAISEYLFSPDGAKILGALFLISEALASIPSIKANSVFQIIANFLSRFATPPVAPKV
jgi:hypothetical protein